MGDLPPSKEPEGGQIIRGADGLPSGVFVDNAMNLVPIPQWTNDEMELFFQTTMKEALSYGLTSIHDADALPHYVEFFKK